LFDIWPFIKAQFPRATLDIYYSWQSWGILSPAKEAKMRALLRQLEGVREHGLVSHQEISQAYARASFWTYPCIFKEVFCISALRAQLSGAVPVIIDGSAFVETVRHGYKCHRPEEYYDLLVNAMRGAEMISLDQRKAMGQFVLEEFTWKKVASKWKELFFRETNH
jgi:glycosyltransferase involved in cell wall biosynthesis